MRLISWSVDDGTIRADDDRLRACPHQEVDNSHVAVDVRGVWLQISEQLLTEGCRLLAAKAKAGRYLACDLRLHQLARDLLPEPDRLAYRQKCDQVVFAMDDEARDVVAKPGEVVLTLSRQELDQVIFACEGLMVLTETLDRIFGLRTQVNEQEAQLVATYVELVSELQPIINRLREVRS